jgi:hypothetical protein
MSERRTYDKEMGTSGLPVQIANRAFSAVLMNVSVSLWTLSTRRLFCSAAKPVQEVSPHVHTHSARAAAQPCPNASFGTPESEKMWSIPQSEGDNLARTVAPSRAGFECESCEASDAWDGARIVMCGAVTQCQQQRQTDRLVTSQYTYRSCHLARHAACEALLAWRRNVGAGRE